MDPLTLGLGGAGLGFLKSQIFDRGAEQRDRALQAETARYSPWTGLQPTAVKRADPLGSTLQGGMAGASFGQGLAANKAATAGAAATQAAPQVPGQFNLGLNPYQSQMPQNFSPYFSMMPGK